MARLLFAILLLADLVDEWLGWLPPGLLPDVRDHFGVHYTKASLVLTAHFVGGYVGSVFGGVLADFWDRRCLLLSGAALYVLGLGLAGAATSFGLLLAACACIGLASGPLVHTAQVLLVDRARARGERLERALGRFNALGSAGDLLGPASVALGLGAGLGWRWLFAAGAGVMLAYGIGLSVASRAPLPRCAPSEEDARPGLSRVLTALTDRRLLRLALALALLDALDEPFAGFVVLYLRDVAVASAAWANVAVAVLVGSTLVGFTLAERLTLSPARQMRVFLLALAAALVAFVLAPTLPVKIAALALIGATSAGFYTVALSAALSLLPGLAGTATSVLSLVGALSLLFPPAVGALADKSGLAQSMWVYAALPLAMLLLVRRTTERGAGPGRS